MSDTDDDGRRTRLRAERRDDIFQGTINGSAFTASGYIIPSSLWHRDTPASEALFDVVDGRLKVVQPRFIGRDLVRAAWRARDGSRIVLEPR